MNHAAVIGGGPAGLMAAEVLAQSGIPVDLFEAMPSAGRKFLVAGKGGLNLTYSEELEAFLSRYGSRRSQLEPLLLRFGPQEIRTWFEELGFETYVGSSGRVFPIEMKAGPVLHAWVKRLRETGVRFHVRHRWDGWDEEGRLHFETPNGEVVTMAQATVLALGGGSWARLGSTGAWVPLLEARGVRVVKLRPANCGFNAHWSDGFQHRFAGQPVKTVVVTFSPTQGRSIQLRGEFVITGYGVEGSLVYAISAALRDEIEAHKQAKINLDLAPDWTVERLAERLARPRGKRTFSSHLERAAGLKGVKTGLLRELISPDVISNPAKLAAAIKAVPLVLLTPRPLDEAISTAGGVAFEELDPHLMLRRLPGVFCAGEMLDWEAPTGGYLLTACFSSGRAAGLGAVDWLAQNTQTLEA